MPVREDWESGSLPSAYVGDRGDWTVQSNTVDSGNFAAEVNAGFGDSIISRDDQTISPGSKLTLANWRNVISGSQAPVGVVFGGPSTAGVGSWSGYSVGFDTSGNIVIIRYDSGSRTPLDTGSQGAPGTAWQDLVVEWESNGTITARMFDGNGSQIGSDTTANDSTYSGGAWGFIGTLNGSVVDELATEPLSGADVTAPDTISLTWNDSATHQLTWDASASVTVTMADNVIGQQTVPAAGENIERTIEVDEDGSDKDITDATVEWYLVPNRGSDNADATIDHDTTGVDVSISDASAGEITLSVNQGVTDDLAGQWWQRIVVDDSGDGLQKWVGPFEIAEA